MPSASASSCRGYESDRVRDGRRRVKRSLQQDLDTVGREHLQRRALGRPGQAWVSLPKNSGPVCLPWLDARRWLRDGANVQLVEAAVSAARGDRWCEADVLLGILEVRLLVVVASRQTVTSIKSQRCGLASEGMGHDQTRN